MKRSGKTTTSRKALGGAKRAIQSIYKRMSAVGKAGLDKLCRSRNRSGYDASADADDLAYIEREAHDILGAVARIRDRAASSYPLPEDFGMSDAPVATEAHDGSPTTSEIKQLKAEAASVGDYEMVSICNSALEGDPADLAECQRAIDSARAQDDSNMTRGSRNRSYGGTRYPNMQFSGPVRLREIKLNRGGYDSGGRYYGYVPGEKVYAAETDDYTFSDYFRAKDRKQAIATLLAKYPNIKLARKG